MALDHLLDALAHEAQATADLVRNAARAEADRITTLSVETAERRRQAEVDQVVRARRDQAEETATAARRAARDDVLRARARLLSRVGSAVRAAFPATLTGPRYREALPGRIEGALACFDPEASVSARSAAALTDPIQAAWPRERKVAVRADETLGSGYVLTNADGSIEIEDTLEACFEAHRPELERQALELLGIET
jgi:vacuolar-type H+-ATPase subunit E/Vma4